MSVIAMQNLGLVKDDLVKVDKTYLDELRAEHIGEMTENDEIIMKIKYKNKLKRYKELFKEFMQER